MLSLRGHIPWSWARSCTPEYLLAPPTRNKSCRHIPERLPFLLQTPPIGQAHFEHILNRQVSTHTLTRTQHNHTAQPPQRRDRRRNSMRNRIARPNPHGKQSPSPTTVEKQVLSRKTGSKTRTQTREIQLTTSISPPTPPHSIPLGIKHRLSTHQDSDAA